MFTFVAMRVFGYDIKLQRRQQGHRHHTHTIDVFTPKMSFYNFAKSEILDCQKMISNRLANVEYGCKVDFIASNNIFKFMYDNRLQLVRRIFFDGYVIINTDTLEFVDTTGRQVFKSYDGKVTFELCSNEIMQASETFESTGLSDFCFLKDKIRFLNVVNSADMNLIENYGAMGIVSPESDSSVAGAEFEKEDIEELQKRYKDSYGITLGKWSLMFVPRPTKYSKIDLPIAQLQLAEKRKYILQAIYAAFGIPKELSVYFESTKYANRNEAELDFYSSTITAWADLSLCIVKKIYLNLMRTHSYLLTNEFWYDFVGVFALQEAMRVEKERAREELAFWREIKETMPEHSETAAKRIENLIESL